jgi:tetratricopeptide (TPR) repeat protein
MSVCSNCGEVLSEGRCLRCSALDALGRLCFNHALTLLKRGKRAAAEEHLCAACALMPTRVEARRSLGKLRAQLGRYEAARVDLSLALQLAPGDARTAAALTATQVRLLLRRGWVAAFAVLAMVVALVMLRLGR